MDQLISKEVDGNLMIVQVNGPLDGMSAPYLSAENILTDATITGVVLDCARISFMDSAGVSGIVKLFKTLGKQDIKLVIAGIKDQPKSVVDVLQLDKAIAMFEDVAAAKASF